MENENENEGILGGNLALSAAGGFTRSLVEMHLIFNEIMDECESQPEKMAPSDVMKLMTGLINVFSYGIAAADASEPDSNDATVYLYSAFCHHEGLVKLIETWEPSDYEMASYMADETDSKYVEMINEYRPIFTQVFKNLHEHFHNDKIIIISDYEKEMKKLTMKLANHPEAFKLHITNGEDLRYDNICKEDVEAIITMAGKFEMEELHDWDAAQAAASHVNDLIGDKSKSAKDLEEFDLMNACLGYAVIDMNDNGGAQLQEFLKNCIKRDQEMSGDKKYQHHPDGSPNILQTSLPTYKLGNGKVLVFEPTDITETSPEKIEEGFKSCAKEEIAKGLRDLAAMSNPELITEEVASFVDGSMLTPENIHKAKDRDVMRSVITWLGSWAGHPANFPNGLKAAGIEKLSDLKDTTQLDTWEGSCIFDGLKTYFANKGKDFIIITLEMAVTIGLLQTKGPHGLALMVVNDDFSPVYNLKGMNSFKKQMNDNGYTVETDIVNRKITIRQKKAE